MESPYTDSLAHTTWECKYHIVFVLKYRRKEIYGKLRQEIGMILRELYRRKEVEIISAEACMDHIHMYVSIPPKLCISSFIGYLIENNKTAVYKYLENQLKEDMMTDQLTIKEYKDYFKCGKY